MSQTTNIEWTDSTWNPIRGCTPVSPGCQNCYAATMAKRFSKPGQWGDGLVRINSAGQPTDDWSGKVNFVADKMLDPVRWRKPRRIFVNSVSDLFHEGVSVQWIDLIFAVIAMSPSHTFQLLTKRPNQMLAYLSKFELAHQWADYLSQIMFDECTPCFSDDFDECTPYFSDDAECHIANSINGVLAAGYNVGWPMRNVILGVSVEDQQWAAKRHDALAEVSRAGWRTMVSYEPALSPVDWSGWQFLDWLISGGESGPDARPTHPDWHRAVRDFSAEHGIPYFFKQWGEYLPVSDDSQGPHVQQIDGHKYLRTGKKSAGCLLDGQIHKSFPLSSIEVRP